MTRDTTATPFRPASNAAASTNSVRRRIVSLETFRGFDMFWIVGG